MANAYYTGLDTGFQVSGPTITYAFSDAYFSWTTHEEVQFRAALKTWSDVANIRFVETANEAAADFRLFNVNDSVVGGALGQFELPEGGQQYGYFNYEGTGWDWDDTTGGLDQGGYGFLTIIHEIGHGLGLAHPHDADGTSTIFPGVSHAYDTGKFGLNQGLYTVMSYNDGRVADGLDPEVTVGYGWSGTPMALDIYAIQQIYGANNTYKTGNDTYLLPESNGEGTFYQAIWDAGGRDKIAYGGSGTATIDLRAATLRDGDPNAGGFLSKANGVYGGYTIAKGVTIEDASGGSGRDIIYGNSARNIIDGNAGNDSLLGFAGNDIVRGGDGIDVILGGTGNDLLAGGSGDDRINGQSGNDRIFGQDGKTIAYGGEGRDLVVGGSSGDALYGQSEGDRLLGGIGADYLSGGTGNDAIYGGTDNDRALGGSGNDFLFGESGNDVLLGQSGQDRIFGQSGNDILNGQAGNDRIFGGAGDDRIIDGAGNDTVAGGAGDDRYLFGAGDDNLLLTNTWGDDTVFNFQSGNDILDFSRVSGLQFYGQLQIVRDGSDTVVSFGGDSVRLVNVLPWQIDNDDIIL